MTQRRFARTVLGPARRLPATWTELLILSFDRRYHLLKLVHVDANVC